MRLVIRLAIIGIIAVFLWAHQREVRNAADRMGASFRGFKRNVVAFGKVVGDLPESVTALKEIHKELEAIKESSGTVSSDS